MTKRLRAALSFWLLVLASTAAFAQSMNPPAFIQRGGRAVTRPWLDKVREIVLSVTDYGAVCNDTSASAANNRAAFQAAIDAASTLAIISGGAVRVQVPQGAVCQIASDLQVSGAIYYALLPKSNVWLIGPGTVKLADSQTASSTRDPNLFYKASGTLSNVRIEGVVFDMNAANNSLPTTGIWANSVFQSAETLVTDFEFNNNIVKNHNGSNTVLILHTTPAATLSKGVNISGNNFYRVGLSTADHSTINTFAEDVRVVNNRFANADADTYSLYIAAPFESHGSNTIFVNNTVNNFYKGVMISQNYTRDAVNNVVSGNTFSNITYACMEVSNSVLAASGAFSVDNAVFDGNTCTFKEENTNTNTPYRMGLSLLTGQPVNTVTFSNNIVKRTARTSRSIRHVGIYSPLGTDQKSTARFESVIAHGNTFQNLSLGFQFVSTGAIQWVKHFEFRGNSVFNASDIAAANGYCGYIEGDATYKPSVIIENNKCWDNQGSTTTQYGFDFGDYVANIVLRNNTYLNVTTPVRFAASTVANATSVVYEENAGIKSRARLTSSAIASGATVAHTLTVPTGLAVIPMVTPADTGPTDWYATADATNVTVTYSGGGTHTFHIDSVVKGK